MSNTIQLSGELAMLRGQGRLGDAMDTLDARIAAAPDHDRVPSLLQGVYAAKEAGDLERARGYAREVAKEFPDAPGIRGLI